MANQFGPHFDQLERQRRNMQRIVPADPLAAHRRTLEKAMLLDPIPRRQELLAKITGADRIAEISRSVAPVAPDPFAAQRRAIERLTRRRTAVYEQVVARLTGAGDPFAAQRRTIEKLLYGDPLGGYRRIVGNFDALTGGVMPSLPLAADLAVAEDPAEGSRLPVGLPSRAMAIHLLAIAWLCFCLIGYGVSSALLGDVLIEALALAQYLSESE